MIDVSQPFHIVWPCGGSITDLVGSISEHAAQYPREAEKMNQLKSMSDYAAGKKKQMGNTISQSIVIFQNEKLF